MTIDEHLASQALDSTLGETLEHYIARIRSLNRSDSKANLDPIFIPGAVEPVQTEGADIGVGYNLAHSSTSGLTIVVPVYLNMAANDWIEVFWGDDELPVASDLVPQTEVGKDFSMYVASSKIPEGVHPLYCKVTRAGGGNGGESLPVNVLVRFDFPGGIDPAPHEPGHQNLLPPEPELPDNGIIDEEAAKNGVKVTITAYPNIREYDRITLSWGGVLLKADVTQADIDAGFIDILVTEETILAAGDSDRLILVYRVVDEVHNQSSDWSLLTEVIVEVGEGRLDAPLIGNPDEDAVDWDVIDLDKLGDSDLEVEVMVISGGPLQVGDEVALRWVGTTSLGQDIVVEPAPKSVTRPAMVITFEIPNADLRQLARGRGVASYTASRDSVVVGVSKRAFVTFLGVERGLPKPEVTEALGGTLDPELDKATVVVPGEVLQGGDVVFLTWLGTRANGTPLLFTAQRQVSGGGGGQPMSFVLDGADWIKPLDGGQVSVWYRLAREGAEQPLESERERLIVGEARFELMAPFTRPAPEGGMLDPDQLEVQLEVVVAVYPDMVDGQTVYLFWRASQGPHHDDDMLINEFSAGHEVVFTLAAERVRENLGADVEIWYQVEEPGQPSRRSEPLRVRIGEASAPLPLPEVVEAEGDVLDPADAPSAATVRVPREAGLVAGDTVEVTWAGDKPGGSTRVSRSVDDVDVGEPFDLLVDYQYVVANLDGNVAVSYKVIPASGPQRESDALLLRVQAGDLPLPIFTDAVGDQLDPGDVTGGAPVLIHASAAFKSNDKVTLQVISSVSGGTISIDHTVLPSEAGQALRITVPYKVIEASLGTQITLSYEVQRQAGGPIEASDSNHYWIRQQADSGPLLVMGARASDSGHRAARAPRMLSAFNAQSLQPLRAEWRYEDSGTWQLATQWSDTRPWVKLYVRNAEQAVLLNPANIIGSGGVPWSSFYGAFVALRDERNVGGQPEVDMVAWGMAAYGGKLDSNLIALKNVVEISSMRAGFAARLRDQRVVCWGTVSQPGEAHGYVQVRGADHCFAGQKDDDRLFAWGSEYVPVPPELNLHRDYVQLCGGAFAFAARRASGHVVAWGHYLYGGVLLPGQEAYNDITDIMGNSNSFTALRRSGGTGRVIAWGHKDAGGKVTEEIERLTNVKALAASTTGAFAVILDDNSVRAWGNDYFGAKVPSIIQALTTVVEISSTAHAFCARLRTGNVVAWAGTSGHLAGSVPDYIARMSDIVQVASTSQAFAALRRDGSVVAWGLKEWGGDLSSVASRLVNVRAIYGSASAFTALTASGEVVTWGVRECGGDSSEQQGNLAGKVTHGRAITLEESQTVAEAAAQGGASS